MVEIAALRDDRRRHQAAEWQGRDYDSLKALVHQRVHVALVMCIDKLVKERQDVDVGRFLADADAVRQKYFESR